MTRLFALSTAGLIGMLCVTGASAQAPVEEIHVESEPVAPPVQVPAEAATPESVQPAPSADQVPTEATTDSSEQAATRTDQAPTDQAPTEATQTVSAQGVPYLSGGIGEDEREQLSAAASDYNLKLVFAEASGAYVADVLVIIKNAEGSTLLDANATGPLFFAKLPAGEYSVQASYRGATDTRTVNVSETGQRALDFRW